MLGAGILTIVVIGWLRRPEIRPYILRGLGIVAVVSAAYFPAFWHSTSTFGQPARAIKSVISPDSRDASSDLYRTQEDKNLEYNIRHAGLIGKGFGVQIDYALPIYDLRASDPELDYIPHNGVLYVLMRMGLLGGIAMWSLISAGIIAGCRLTKCRDREITVIGALVVCGMLGYALEGATDQGFYFYRIAFVTGALLGLAEAARHILSTGGDELPAEPDARDLLSEPADGGAAPTWSTRTLPIQ